MTYEGHKGEKQFINQPEKLNEDICVTDQMRIYYQNNKFYARTKD